MKLKHWTVLTVAAAVMMLAAAGWGDPSTMPSGDGAAKLAGPLAPVEGALAVKYPMSVTEAIAKRRSVRAFEQRPLTADEVSLLCWAAQGITDAKSGHRAAPSAMAVYPMVVYVVTDKGLYEYVPQGHSLKEITSGDAKEQLFTAASQGSFKSAPVVFAIAMDMPKAKARLKNNAERSCFFEAGHIAQNILLQATAMGLAAMPASGFDSRKVDQALGLPEGQDVIYIVPVGQPGKAAQYGGHPSTRPAVNG